MLDVLSSSTSSEESRESVNINRPICNFIDVASDKSFSTDDTSDCTTDDDTRDATMDNNSSLQSSLKQIFVEDNVPLATVGKLLKVLKIHLPELPSDPRTLLKCDRSIILKNLAPGKYYHFKLMDAITEIIDMCEFTSSQVLVLDFHVDGVSLFSSKVDGLWTILGCVRDIKKSEFVIGVYHGPKKPDSVHDFLKDFICDLLNIESCGVFRHRNINHRVFIGKILCDRVARTYLKCIKSHTAYFGCDRCCMKGEWNRSMCYIGVNSNKRTDESFRQQDQPQHHNGESPFTALNTIDMINDFPGDLMHAVCSGVTLRMLLTLRDGSLRVRLSQSDFEKFDALLFRLCDAIPSDFARKPRSIRHVKMWKATELYLFTVYLGFFIMPQIIPPGPKLETCMSYFAFIFILCCENFSNELKCCL